MNEKAIRWRQRYQNLNKAFLQLNDAVNRVDKLSTLEKEGLVQRFEYTFELCWKTLKDYLEAQEVEARFPREVIKYSFQYEIIKNGEAWMEMLEKRNMMAHTYDEAIFNEAIQNIVTVFFPEVRKLMDFLKNQV